ncbi:hypothetical protein [Rheinheimera sp.]|uniref:hypothetical protein n=1 Tax=Rheinheimera sp. TaxID=1869214 RepID=UPI00307EB03C
MDYLYIFRRDHVHYEGVRRINIYLLRLLYLLMFAVMGHTAWSFILNDISTVGPREAVIWSVWGAFAIMAFLGLFKPLKMLPVLLLEIVYKVTWLITVAYPLWSRDQLAGSEAEGLVEVFIPVVLAIVAMPWGYAVKHYIYQPKAAATASA